MMIRSIFFKEYYKIRWLLLVVLLANLGVSIVVLVATRQLFILDHPEIVWYRVLHLGQINYAGFKYIPLFTGLIIAVLQYLPEMWQQRLRLSLHLPVSSSRLVSAHMFIGLTGFCVAILPDALILTWMTDLFFPREAIGTVWLTVLPWFMAGAAAYLGATLVLLEPNVKLKTVNMAVCAGTAGLYLQTTVPGGYAKILGVLVLPLILMALSAVLPAFRFRYRRVV